MYQLLQNNIAKYTELSNDEFQSFIAPFRPQKIKKGEIILKEGDYCHFEGFVNKGCFKVYKLTEDGVERVLYFAAEDWWITDVNSLINNVPSFLNIQALEDSEILMISKKDKEYLYHTIPKVEKLFRIMNQQASVSLQKRIFSTLHTTADQRYLEFIAKYPSIEQRLTQQQVASYLGITHEFLSKV
ncbi:Crp/Fnr family transcriptional regulator, partial [Chryseobacterium sp.]|uniref:Crp/Fnr family transcriptional regulator n=1 Tax=Chryseobacterium sp. TaxID=1871047 RepID=UPI0025C63728